MPVTAKLSKAFYDRLGEGIAEFDTKLSDLKGELSALIERRIGEQTRWFFIA